MAATGSNHKERRLAQPPGSFCAFVWRTLKLHSPFWVAAVLLVVVLCLVALPPASSSAQIAALSPAATSSVVVPILYPMEKRVSWTDTFGAARSGGRTHAGNDLMAPKMTPLLAVVDGTLDWMNFTGQLSSYNNLPYYNILLRGDDGNDYFYIHLNNDTPGTDDGKGGTQYAYAPGPKNGSRVHCGDDVRPTSLLLVFPESALALGDPFKGLVDALLARLFGLRLCDPDHVFLAERR